MATVMEFLASEVNFDFMGKMWRMGCREARNCVDTESSEELLGSNRMCTLYNYYQVFFL